MKLYLVLTLVLGLYTNLSLSEYRALCALQEHRGTVPY